MNQELAVLIRQTIDEAGGWLPFDRFMALALYAPGLGYYSNELQKFGLMPQSGSDFVTAPELSPLFGRALAAQVGQALAQTGTTEVWEFGAGTGALAAQLLDSMPLGLHPAGQRYPLLLHLHLQSQTTHARLRYFSSPGQAVHNS